MSNITNFDSSDTQHINYNTASAFLSNYFIWIVFAFGFPGNIISCVVIVLMSRHKRRTSLFHVGLLSIVDNMVIIFKIIGYQEYNKKISVTETGCHLMYVFGLTLTSFANWILVVISIERFTAVMFSMKIMAIWSFKRAVIVISCVLLVLFLVHIHIFFTTTTYDNVTCQSKAQFRAYKHAWFYVSASMYAIGPALLIIVFNALTIWKLWKSAQERESLFVRPDLPSAESRKQEKQVTVVLVTLAIVFVLLTIPKCVYALFIWPMSFKEMNPDKKRFLNVLTNCLCDLNHVVNFYLYFCLVKKFRQYCVGVLPCKRRKSKIRESGDTESTQKPDV